MREGLNFADIESSSARTDAINEFVDIVQGLPYRVGVDVLTMIRERVIINHLGEDDNGY
tara:strand:+ start:3186 stop:3362 length:177 start_codon:yes stop_codon:yes gene_type:complete